MNQDYQTQDRNFFADRDRITRVAADTVITLLMDWVAPKSVIDLGCGVGTWLDTFKSKGVERVYGVESMEVEPGRLCIPADCFERADLSQPFAHEPTYDLAMSLEVAEHLPPEAAEHFTQSLCRLAPVVLFSAAIPGQGGIHHVNEQWPTYWVEKFRACGCVVIDAVRPLIWEREDIKGWYRQNTLIFVREDRLSDYPKLEAMRAQTRMNQLNLVHPQILEWKLGDHRQAMSKMDQLTVGEVARLIPGVLRRSVASRLGRVTGRRTD